MAQKRNRKEEEMAVRKDDLSVPENEDVQAVEADGADAQVGTAGDGDVQPVAAAGADAQTGNGAIGAAGQPYTAAGTGAAGTAAAGTAAVGGEPMYDDAEDVARAQAEQEKAIADNKVLTNARNQGMDDADMRAALVNAPDEEARKQMIANWLASGKLKWGDVKRLQAESAEELDPELKLQRQKREQRERDMVGLLNMVGALGNLVNATTSRNGRSVQVADMSKAVNEKQATDYAMRQQQLKQLQDAKDKYGAIRGAIIDQAQKDYATRMQQQRAEQLARDKMAQDEAKAMQAANLKREEWARKEALEQWKAEQTMALKELEARTRIRAARIAASGKGSGSGTGKGTKPKEYKVDGQTYKLRNEVLTDFAVGQLFGILPQEYQNEIRKAQADSRGRESEDGTEQYSYNSSTINMLLGKYSQDKASHEKYPENYEMFKEWLGVLADDDDGGDGGGKTDHKTDPYADEGSGGGGGDDKSDPYGG